MVADLFLRVEPTEIGLTFFVSLFENVAYLILGDTILLHPLSGVG